MPRTIGCHLVFSGYGLWLPGDERGHWSDAWDEQLGYIEPHMLHDGDPIRKRMAQERQAHSRVVLDADMVGNVAAAIGDCSSKSQWHIAAASVESTHSHLLLTYTERDIDVTAKWLKDQTTKAVHRNSLYQGPIWCKGRWRGSFSIRSCGAIRVGILSAIMNAVDSRSVLTTGLMRSQIPPEPSSRRPINPRPVVAPACRLASHSARGVWLVYAHLRRCATNGRGFMNQIFMNQIM